MIQNMCMIKRNYQYKIISPNNLYTRVFFIHKGNPPPVHNKIMLKVKKKKHYLHLQNLLSVHAEMLLRKGYKERKRLAMHMTKTCRSCMVELPVRSESTLPAHGDLFLHMVIKCCTCITVDVHDPKMLPVHDEKLL